MEAKPLSFSLEDSRPPEPPRDGDSWGPWRFSAGANLLVCSHKQLDGYEIRMEEITSAEIAFDWLAQIEEKGVPADALGHLLRAFKALVGLRKLAGQE